MRIVLVFDSQPESGTGHIARSLALFEEFSSMKLNIGVVTDNHERFLRFSHQSAVMVAHDNLQQVRPQNNDVVILDSYNTQTIDYVSSRWSYKNTVQIIDETTPFMEAEIYIAGSVLSDQVRLRFKNKILLDGPEHFLFRKQIRDQVKVLRRQPFSVTDGVILNLGMSSQQSELFDSMKYLFEEMATFTPICLPVALRSYFSNTRLSIDFYEPGELYRFRPGAAWITGGGVSLLESLLMRRRIGVIQVAVNQQEQIEALSQQKHILPLDTSSVTSFLNQIKYLLSENVHLQPVDWDGDGVKRVVLFLLSHYR